ncbi:MAG: menaquinone biosynthesis protein [Deltaproteobacteria bacterium]|nr:menaquinone biosynthesis protein [Deltaproteobacteria bacterium]
MNLGAVPYLNVLPLIAQLEEQPRLEVPAALVRLLKIGELDLATAPIVALFQNPDWSLVDGIGLGTKGAVKSVRLIFNREGINLQNVRSIDAGMESMSSILLVKVLLASKYKRNLEEIEFTGPILTGNEEAQLVIGDKALKTDKGIDLGLEWTSWTNLPFVFAGWVSRQRTIDRGLVQRLKDCRDQSLKNIESIIDEKEFPLPFLKSYLTENISYELGEPEKKGIELFYRYAAELGLAPKGWSLNLI